MRLATSSLTAFALSACAALAAASSAEAGTITAATAEFTVNGKSVTLESGKTLALKKGDLVDAKKSGVSYRSDTGDALLIEAGSVVREEETTTVAAGLFIMKGSVTGTLSEKTQLGAAAGWMTAGKGAKAKVLVESTAGHEDKEALFRAVEGGASVSYRAFTVHLPPAHSVTLDIDAAAPGTLCFRTGQQNAGEVEIDKATTAGQILAFVPKASLGCFTDDAGNKTRICNDINSLKTAKIRLETRFGATTNTAAIGPGTCAVIDNATGAIELAFAAVKFEILERAITLTSEFSTLAQSNFSDVK
jgi:hypothetical protein